jgi:hypothetical protein
MTKAKILILVGAVTLACVGVAWALAGGPV